MEIINKFNIEEIKTEFAELTKSLKIIGKNKKNYKQKLIQINEEIASSSSLEEICNALTNFFSELCDTGKLQDKFFYRTVKRDIFGFSCLKAHLEAYFKLKEGRILEMSVKDRYLSLTLELLNGDIEKQEYRVTKYNTQTNEPVITFTNDDTHIIYPYDNLS